MIELGHWGPCSSGEGPHLTSISVRNLAAAFQISWRLFSDILITVNYSRAAWKKQMHGEDFLNRSKPIYAFIHLNIHTCGHRVAPKQSFHSWLLVKFIDDLKCCLFVCVCVCCSFFLGSCPVPILSLIWTSVIPAVLWTWYVEHSLNPLLILSLVIIKQFLQCVHFWFLCTGRHS